jgi:heme-degrading monooxygenase HmoA
MPYSMARVKVADYSKWKPIFDQLSASRKASGGAKAGTLFRDENDPNCITILTEWDNLKSAHKFIESADVQEAINKSGVIKIDFYFLNKVEQVKI